MPHFLDATDALAAAYCHYLQELTPIENTNKHYNSWKDFAIKNKERIK